MALHHRICHVLGGTYGLVHGDVNAVILPHAVAFNQEGAPEAIARVARALSVEDAASGLFDLAAEIGAPTSLAELGLARGDLEEAARQAAEPPPWNPRAVELEDVIRLLENAFHGRRPAPGHSDAVTEPVGR
jgi:alcohol dehydrogenase class IV